MYMTCSLLRVTAAFFLETKITGTAISAHKETFCAKIKHVTLCDIISFQVCSLFSLELLWGNGMGYFGQAKLTL